MPQLILRLGAVLLAVTLLYANAAEQPSSASTSVLIPDTFMEDQVVIIIDKSDHRLQLYLNGQRIRSFSVATGKGYLTPVGHFRIANKIINPWYMPKKIPGGDSRNPLGKRWMGLDIPGTGGYKYGIHGTNRPYSIGRSISSGCIRMWNRDIEWLFRHIEVGTPVIIQE